MHVQRYYDVREFLQSVETFLERSEAVNNLPLGILFRFEKESKLTKQKAEPFFALVEHKQDIIFVMLMTPPHNMIVYGEGNNLDVAIDQSILFLRKEEILVPGVIGPCVIAKKFAFLWAKAADCTPIIKMEQMIYRLDEVNEIELSSGRLIPATQKDIDLVANWIFEFSKVTLETVSLAEAQKKAEFAVKESCVFLWEDEIPVSMVWKARPTKNGIVVSAVYTPPQFRNRGYATSCVASLSKLLLSGGYRFCSLYTDLSNPTSNSVYRKIGYRPIEPSIVYSFQASQT